VDAADLGGILVLADAADSRSETAPDAVELERLDPRSLELLDELGHVDSMRAAAARLGLHHSTVQQQAASLAHALGYDPRTPAGRVRFTLARSLQLLARRTI
jgi:DNA-binding NarL/FixJ family response regulator